MKNNRATLEVIAQTVEEAIEKGINDLGLPREAVEITVLDEGGQGILGIGSRQARVRISILNDEEEVQPEESPSQTPTSEGDSTLRLTEEIVSELLEKMNLTAKVTAGRKH
jgi:spoIIIJ-associated protein